MALLVLDEFKIKSFSLWVRVYNEYTCARHRLCCLLTQRCVKLSINVKWQVWCHSQLEIVAWIYEVWRVSSQNPTIWLTSSHDWVSIWWLAFQPQTVLGNCMAVIIQVQIQWFIIIHTVFLLKKVKCLFFNALSSHRCSSSSQSRHI